MKNLLERAIHAIRNEKVDPAAEESAAGRVWETVSGQAVETPAWQAWEKAPRARQTRAAETPATRWWPKVAWGAAAAVVVVAGAALVEFYGVPAGGRAVVQSVDGSLYRVSEAGLEPLAAGAEVAQREAIRTGKDTRALLRLAGGSLVEMNERAQLAFSERRSETRIELARGAVIVRAAKRSAGHLRVSTGDALVSVTGTTFAVNRGTKGARVSVVEGEVRVEQGPQETVLRHGQQVATHPSLAAVPVHDEIAWSRDLAVYEALLREMGTVEKSVRASMRGGLRYSSRLLDRVPEGAVFYAAFPNLTGTLAEAHRLLRERIDQNDVLRQWWQQNGNAAGARLEESMEKIRALGDQLGEEIVVTFSLDAAGKMRGPLVMAEVRGGESRERLEAAARQLSGENTFTWTGDGVLAMSPELLPVQQLAAGRTLASGSFRSRIADAYRDGAEWLVSADLERLIGAQASAREQTMFGRLGVHDLRNLVFERKEAGGKTENRMTLSFGDARQGLASWISSPAPMGALQFFSPDANLVAAFVVKDPAGAVDELFQLLAVEEADFPQELARAEAQLGVSVRNDLAAPLGGEVAVGLDGPLLPEPSWKAVVEVYDPGRLQSAIERLVSNHSPLRMNRETSGRLTFYSITTAETSKQLHYVYARGFLVAAPNRALLAQALQYVEAGAALARSAQFTSLLPLSTQPNFSALLYLNFGPALKPLAGLTGNAKDQPAWLALAGQMKPALIYAYAERDRIVLASTDREGLFGISTTGLLGLAGPQGLQGILGVRKQEK